jgi:hypothetical protein
MWRTGIERFPRQCRGQEVPLLHEYGPIRQPHTLRSDYVDRVGSSAKI